jgi:hypothetical protein
VPENIEHQGGEERNVAERPDEKLLALLDVIAKRLDAGCNAFGEGFFSKDSAM